MTRPPATPLMPSGNELSCPAEPPPAPTRHLTLRHLRRRSGRSGPEDEAANRVETTPAFRLAVFGGAALVIAAAAGLKLAL